MCKAFRLLDNRYFHSVRIETRDRPDIEEVWESCRKRIRPAKTPDKVLAELSVSHRLYETDEPFGSEETRSRIVEEYGRLAYEVFAISWEKTGTRYVVLGVPYVDIGRKIVKRIREDGLLKSAEFTVVDLDVLESADLDSSPHFRRARIRSVDVSVGGLRDVSRFSISGSRVVESELYRTVRHLISGANPTVKRAILNVRRPGVTSLSVHLDTYGNVKAWIQESGKNLGAFADLFATLEEIHAVKAIGASPLDRGQSQEARGGV